MKKMFIAMVIGLVAALFGIPQCSEARTIDLAGGYIMEYDESSLYVINRQTQHLEFNVLQRYNYGEWVVGHYLQIPGSNQWVKVSINDLPFRSYHIWNDANGAVFRSVWKIIYGYGFS